MANSQAEPGSTLVAGRPGERDVTRPAPAPEPRLAHRGASVASAGLLLVEVVGIAVMWVAIPIGWMWIGGRVYDATGSLGAYGAVAFFGFVGTAWLAMTALRRIDGVWVTLRRRAGFDQAEGALVRVVVAAFTLGIVAFYVWYYLLSEAYVLPFMPSG
jgi:hypothetical protein